MGCFTVRCGDFERWDLGGVVVGDAQADGRHSTGLMDKHVTSFQVGIIGDQQTSRHRRMMIQRLHHLRRLAPRSRTHIQTHMM